MYSFFRNLYNIKHHFKACLFFVFWTFEWHPQCTYSFYIA